MKREIIFAILFFLSLDLFSQSSIQWQKCIGGTGEDIVLSIIQATEGGYIGVGYTLSNDGDIAGNHGSNDGLVIKLDSSGNLKWQRSLGGTIGESFNCIIACTGGGYLAVGGADSNDGDVSGNHGNSDCWIVKLDTAGNIQWQKCYGGSGTDYAISAVQTNDGGYIFSGLTNSLDGDVSGNHDTSGFSPDAWVVKIDSGGTIEWQKCLGGTDEDQGFSIIQTQDGGYIVACSSRSNDGDVSGNHGMVDYWIVKLSSTGNIQWQKCYGGEVDEFPSQIIQLADGTYVITGYTYSFGGQISGAHGLIDVWMIKILNSGVLQWQKCLGGSGDDVSFSLQVTTDGGYIVGGSSGYNDGDVSGNHGMSDYWAVKLDNAGILQWQKCLGGTQGDDGYSIIQTTDGGYVFAGETHSNDGDVTGYHLNGDAWIVKLSYDVGIKEAEEISMFSLYPNPVTDNLVIDISSFNTEKKYLSIYNVMGEEILKPEIINPKSEINISDLPSGIYFAEVRSGKGIMRKKFVKE